MSSLRSYVPSAISFTVFGIAMEGFSPDSVVDIERLEASTTFRKAMDGSGTAFLDKYGTYRVTLHLEQTSESNTILHLIFKVYQMTGINIAMPLSISDRSGSTSFISVDTFFENEPPSNFGSESGTSTWTFLCHNASYTKGGNSESHAMYSKLQSIMNFVSSVGAITGGLGLDLTSLKDKLSSGLSSAINEIKSII